MIVVDLWYVAAALLLHADTFWKFDEAQYAQAQAQPWASSGTFPSCLQLNLPPRSSPPLLRAGERYSLAGRCGRASPPWPP